MILRDGEIRDHLFKVDEESGAEGLYWSSRRVEVTWNSEMREPGTKG